MIRIIAEIILSVPSPDYIEVICDFFVVLYPVLTAYFMFHFDKRARSAVYGMFGITENSIKYPIKLGKKVPDSGNQ